MNRLTFLLCISLPLTNLSFFTIGLAEFTLFHALMIVFAAYSFITFLYRRTISRQVPISYLVLAALVIYMSCVNIFFAGAIKITSYLYSLVIVIELFIMNSVARTLELEDIRKIVKTTIWLYAINIFLGFILIKIGVIPTGFLGHIIQIYDDGRMIRPGGFSSEPSYAAIILVFALYVVLKHNNFLYQPKDKWLYVCTIVSILLTGSSYGYMLLGIVLLYFLIKSELYKPVLKFLERNPAVGFAILLVISIVLVVSPINMQNKSVQRLVNIYLILQASGWDIIGSITEIALKDSSAGMRLQPTIHLFEYYLNIDFSHAFFGKGAGQSTTFFTTLYLGQVTLLGFIPAYVFNYGIIGTIIAFVYFHFVFPKKRFLFSVIFLLFLFNADFNTQIFVFILFTAMLSQQIERLTAETNNNME